MIVDNSIDVRVLSTYSGLVEHTDGYMTQVRWTVVIVDGVSYVCVYDVCNTATSPWLGNPIVIQRLKKEN